MIHIIDLKFLGVEQAIASYLIETEKGPILIETGPYSTFKTLTNAISKIGYQAQDIKHVFLTHIHLDHAGSAWAFAEMGAHVYVHPFGAKNMEDPSRLMASATQIYGDQMDRLWGQMKKIDGSLLIEVQNEEVFDFGNVKVKAYHTPGHAKHHIAWEVDKNVFTGDVAGVKIGNGPVVPPCPPPDINLEDWKASIALLRKIDPKSLFLTHFDRIDSIKEHLIQLEEMLDDWSLWIKDRWKSETAEELTPKFSEYTRNQLISYGVSEDIANVYEAANPSWMSVAGLIRYWKKKEQ